MAHQPTNKVRTSADPEYAGADRTVPNLKPPELSLFRFGLRQLFWFVAVVSTLLAGMVASNGITALVLLLGALVVAAHVAGTALGSHLRWHADRVRAWEADHDLTTRDGATASLGTADLAVVRSAPRSPWHGRGSTSLPWLSRLIAAGAILGGCGGAALLTLTMGHRFSLAGVIVGAVSTAVLGGWFAFLGGSFYGVLRHGFREALAEQKKDEAGHTPRQ